MLTTPPGYRPMHFEAAVNAKKHVFTEKPIATDATGVRRFLAAARKAPRTEADRRVRRPAARSTATMSRPWTRSTTARSAISWR